MSCGVGTIQVRFDATNPEAEAWVRGNGARLIREVSEETREAVREIVARSFADGLTTRQSARLIREIVGLTRRQATAVANLRARMVARGVKAQTVDARVARYAGRLRKDRAETIARTETMRAANEGQVQLWKQARGRGMLGAGDKRVWITTPDERLCAICAPMEGALAPIESDEWTLTTGAVVALGLPAHPRCRCTTALDLA